MKPKPRQVGTPRFVAVPPQAPLVVKIKEPGGLNRKIGCADLFVYGVALVVLFVIGSCAIIGGMAYH